GWMWCQCSRARAKVARTISSDRSAKPGISSPRIASWPWPKVTCWPCVRLEPTASSLVPTTTLAVAPPRCWWTVTRLSKCAAAKVCRSSTPAKACCLPEAKTMLLRFTKMHGLGNDFMVIDLISQHAHIQPKHARQWGDRHTGVGFDQLLLVEPPHDPDVDFRYRILSSGGSEVEQCGNGARCFARFVLDKRLTTKRRIRVESKGGVIELNIRADGQIGVDMGPPRLVPSEIPFQADAEALSYPLKVDGQQLEIAAISMGNPHAVLRVDDLDKAPVHELGPRIEHHPRFPQRVNAGFLQVVDRQHARLRVWERGAGETQACGTGACAAAVAAIRQGWMDSPVQIDLPGGRLSIEWAGPGQPVMMTGPAVRVYEGQVRL